MIFKWDGLYIYSIVRVQQKKNIHKTGYYTKHTHTYRASRNVIIICTISGLCGVCSLGSPHLFFWYVGTERSAILYTKARSVTHLKWSGWKCWSHTVLHICVFLVIACVFCWFVKLNQTEHEWAKDFKGKDVKKGIEIDMLDEDKWVSKETNVIHRI